MMVHYEITLKGLVMATIYEASKAEPDRWFWPRELADRHAHFMEVGVDEYWRAEGERWRPELMSLVLQEEPVRERWGQFRFAIEETQ